MPQLFGAFALALALTGQAGGPDEEARLFVLVNTARASLGLEALPRDPGLDEVARRNSRRMARRLRVQHSPAGFLRNLLPRWQAVAENVGAGDDVGQVHALMLASPRHRDNLFGSYRDLGLGVERGIDGRVYVTLVFAGARQRDASPVGR